MILVQGEKFILYRNHGRSGGHIFFYTNKADLILALENKGLEVNGERVFVGREVKITRTVEIGIKE